MFRGARSAAIADASHFASLSGGVESQFGIPLGILVTATAVVALIVGLATDLAPSTITGVGAGLSLTVFGALIGALRQPRPRPKRPRLSKRTTTLRSRR
jgi:hypothetical protein